MDLELINQKTTVETIESILHEKNMVDCRDVDTRIDYSHFFQKLLSTFPLNTITLTTKDTYIVFNHDECKKIQIEANKRLKKRK